MRVKTNTKLFRSSTMFVTSIYKNKIYHIAKPSSRKKSFAYKARIAEGLTYKIYKNLLMAVIEKRSATPVTYDIV